MALNGLSCVSHFLVFSPLVYIIRSVTSLCLATTTCTPEHPFFSTHCYANTSSNDMCPWRRLLPDYNTLFSSRGVAAVRARRLFPSTISSSVKNNQDTPVAVHFTHRDHSWRVTVLERAPTDIVQRQLLEKLWINRLRGSQLFTVLNGDNGLGILVLWIQTWFCLFLYFLCQFLHFSFSPCACVNPISLFHPLSLLLLLPYLAPVHWCLGTGMKPLPLLRAHASIRSLHFSYFPPYLFYRTWRRHRGTDVSLSRYRYVTPFFPLCSLFCWGSPWGRNVLFLFNKMRRVRGTLNWMGFFCYHYFGGVRGISG